MKKYLYDYIKHIDDKISNDNVNSELIEEHLVKIKFFQHERLIHLLVTLTYAILFVISSLITIFNLVSIIVVIITILFLIPYIKHYFSLENGVQYLYKQYDLMKEKK